MELRGVTKHYHGGVGIDDVNLEVRRGEVFAFLGPNGAGKTTTIRLLLDLIRPDAGQISIFGLDPRTHGNEVRSRVGYLPGELGLYDRLTARELLSHFAHLRNGLPWNDIAAIARRFSLDVDRPIRTLSKGNRQKVGLVQAIMGDPELLILDEPTTGLDPLVQHQVLQLMRDTADRGHSVFLSSHILSEVAQVADRVGMIKDGRVISTERVEDLSAKAVHHVDVRFAEGTTPEQFSGLSGVTVRESLGRSVQLEVSGALDPVIQVIARHSVVELTIREPSLEELFLSAFDGLSAAPSMKEGSGGT